MIHAIVMSHIDNLNWGRGCDLDLEHILYATGLIGIAVCLVIISLQRPSRVQTIVQLLMVSIGVMMLGRWFRINSSTVEALIICKKLVYLGNCWIYFLLFLFYLHYFQINLSKRIIIPLVLLSSGLTIATFTIEQHPFFYQSYHYMLVNGVLQEVTTYGVLHTVYMLQALGYCLAMLIINLCYIFKRNERKNKEPLLLFIAILLPTFLHLLLWMGAEAAANYELCAYVISGLLLLYVFKKSSILNIYESAADTVLASIQDGLILTNAQFMFQNANTVALQIFPELQKIKKNSQPLQEISESLQKIISQEDYSVIQYHDRIYKPSVKVLQKNETISGYLLWLSDMTDSVARQDAQRLNEARLRTIYEQIDDVVFEWDLDKNSIHYSPLFAKRYGYLPVDKRSSIHNYSGYIHPEDFPKVKSTQEAMKQGAPFTDIEYRLKKYTHDGMIYVWCRVRAKSIFDQQGTPYLVIGTISDIDDQKKKLTALEEQVQSDPLTGLLNKRSVLAQIEEQLNPQGHHKKHAILILDIDNFRQLNEQLGHLDADIILQEIARRIQQYFQESGDICGRFGGDEFIIYLDQVTSEEALEKQLTAFMEILAKPHRVQEKSQAVFCTIGVALYPMHGEDLTNLFQHADKALYQAKGNGKNRFTWNIK